jgi:hypothetical protein
VRKRREKVKGKSEEIEKKGNSRKRGKIRRKDEEICIGREEWKSALKILSRDDHFHTV